jgi:hypothetical protein
VAKVALLTYHKNIQTLYKPEWIEQYKKSIEGQSFKDFQIFEFNYGGTNDRIFENSFFESFPYPTFIHALNYLLDKVSSGGYHYVFNSNVDDWARSDWMHRLLSDIKKGYDLVSSNFCLVKDDKIFKYHNFHNLDILSELERGHNLICHPAVCYSKTFLAGNRYIPEEQPEEDLKLWQRAIRSGSKFFINEENLLFHRIHNNAVCRSQNR